MAKFGIEESVLSENLISGGWNSLVERMRAYKRIRFPEDTRFITLCSYTLHGTLRVEFK